MKPISMFKKLCMCYCSTPFVCFAPRYVKEIKEKYDLNLLPEKASQPWSLLNSMTLSCTNYLNVRE